MAGREGELGMRNGLTPKGHLVGREPPRTPLGLLLPAAFNLVLVVLLDEANPLSDYSRFSSQVKDTRNIHAVL